MVRNSNAMIEQFAYARAGLLGNPSDGYNGKTISVIVRNFRARVELRPSKALVIKPAANEGLEFKSIEELTNAIDKDGYYGGVRLLKAAIKRFHNFANASGQTIDPRNFSISYSSNIPRQVGLAGSSAIVMATIRGLMEWYDVQIPPHLLASLTLSAESDLGIPAGLQDRVIQAYEGLVFMDFSTDKMSREHGLEFGQYEKLDENSIPNLYIAYSTNAGEPTEVLHNDLKQRYSNGESHVVNAMRSFAQFAEDGRQALTSDGSKSLSRLIDQNFDLRNDICQLHHEHRQMIETARICGASAKYCGSGGAIIGIYTDDDMLNRLKTAFEEIDCCVIRPK